MDSWTVFSKDLASLLNSISIASKTAVSKMDPIKLTEDQKYCHNKVGLFKDMLNLSSDSELIDLFIRNTFEFWSLIEKDKIAFLAGCSKNLISHSTMTISVDLSFLFTDKGTTYIKDAHVNTLIRWFKKLIRTATQFLKHVQDSRDYDDSILNLITELKLDEKQIIALYDKWGKVVVNESK